MLIHNSKRRNFTGPFRSPVYEYDASASGFSYAMKDLAVGLTQVSLAVTLIRVGFIQRHNGFLPAVFWTLILASVTIGGMSILWGEIFGADLRFYLPYVACGLIVWGLVSSLVNNAAGVFIAARSVYSQATIARSLFAIRSVGIELLGFAIKLVVLAGAMLIVSRTPSLLGVALSFAGLILILVTGFSLCLSIGILGARYRDVPNLANVAMTFAFFVTPVFWIPTRLGNYSWVVDFNPLYHYLNVVRGPLLNLENTSLSFAVVCCITVVVVLIGVLSYGAFARRLNYWN